MQLKGAPDSLVVVSLHDERLQKVSINSEVLVCSLLVSIVSEDHRLVSAPDIYVEEEMDRLDLQVSRDVIAVDICHD